MHQKARPGAVLGSEVLARPWSWRVIPAAMDPCSGVVCIMLHILSHQTRGGEGQVSMLLDLAAMQRVHVADAADFTQGGCPP